VAAEKAGKLNKALLGAMSRLVTARRLTIDLGGMTRVFGHDQFGSRPELVGKPLPNAN
jgi:hypothetical protein